MKHLLSLLVLLTLLIAPATVAIGRTYDNSANIALRKKLEDAFSKKYPFVKVVNKDGSVEYIRENCPLNAYRDEVVTPYYLQKDYTPHYID